MQKDWESPLSISAMNPNSLTEAHILILIIAPLLCGVMVKITIFQQNSLRPLGVR